MYRTLWKTTLSLTLSLALCLSQGIPSSTLAAPVADEGEGSLFTTQFKKGMRLVQRQQWEDALEAFQTAYDARTKPHPELLLYIAKAHLKLGQGGSALKFYAQFVTAAPSPTEAQRHEVRVGMARAQAMLEAKPSQIAQSTVVHSSDESVSDGSASAAMTLARKTESSARPKSDANTESDKPMNTTPVDPTTASTEKTVRAVIIGRKHNMPYTVSVGSGERLCTAPCEMQVPSGPKMVTVSGPGNKQFQQGLALPGVPFKMTVQHFTLSRVIAGPLLILLSGAFLGGAIPLSITPFRNASDREAAIAGSIPLYVHAGVFFFVGIGQLAAIKRNSIDIQPLAGPMAFRPSPLRLANLSVAPSENGKGAVASVGFRF